MKTNFQSRNKQRTPYNRRILIVVFIFVVGAIFFSLSAGGFIRIFSPIWSGENAFGRVIRDTYLFVETKNALIKQNQYLLDRINADEVLLASNGTAVGNQNKLLENLGRTPNRKGITAAILVHPPETPYDILIIDIGSDNGVVVGQEVSLPANPASDGQEPKVGVVSEVYKKQSRVELFSASGEKTNAVLERNSVPVVLLGRGGGNFEFSLPRDASVVVGDKILSADINHVLIGVVGDVEMEATDSFKKVLVVSVLNIYTENFVTVLQ
jgi:cell shape-determining protein MreC